MWGRADERIANAAKLIVGVATIMTDPTGLSAIGLAADGHLGLKDIFRISDPDAKAIEKRVRTELQTAFDNPRVHMPTDASKLVPQMIEASVPIPEEIAGIELVAETPQAKTNRLLEVMIAKFDDTEYASKYELVECYCNILRPVYAGLFADDSFAKVHGPALARATYTRLSDLADAMVSMSATYGTLAGSLDDLRALRRTELELLCLKFGLEITGETTPADMVKVLTLKAEEALPRLASASTIPPDNSRLSELRKLARAAAQNLDFDKVDGYLKQVSAIRREVADEALGRIEAARETATEALNELAKVEVERAQNALLQGETEQAYDILSATADSFRSVDPATPAGMRTQLYKPLYDHGFRYGGAGLALAERMLSEAAAEMHADIDPQLRLIALGNMANAMGIQGTRIGGKEGAAKLADEAKTHRRIANEFPKDQVPQIWGTAQNNLAAALQEQGIRIDGPKGADLLAHAVTAFRDALSVRTRAEHPVAWAQTQNNLGNALSEQGIRTGGPKGAELLAQAVTSFRDALTVRTRADHPVQWATTQNNLANVLGDLAIMTEGEAARPLQADALKAYTDLLEVRTNEHHPVQWAETQQNLAATHLEIANHDATAEPAPHLTAALDHVDAALTVFDPEHMSYNHTKATALRDHITAALADR